jgi:8-hydroxy-5-deazaflavin:NADPH oxidoreductase
MTVGIVGAGPMGRALACALESAGQSVLLLPGRPAPEKPHSRAGSPAWLPPGCQVVSRTEMWRLATTVLLAVPFPVAIHMMSGPVGQDGSGRTLIDVTNPGFGPGGRLPADRSGGEQIAAAASTWHVAKAFNTVPARHLTACRMHGRPISLPVAGTRRAKAQAFALGRLLGFEPLDAGDIAASRELESLAVMLARISASHGLHGRVGIHIGQPERHPDGGRP